MSDDVKPALGSWLGGLGGDTKKAILLSMAAMFGMWLFGLRRKPFQVTVRFPTRDWHPCSLCGTKTLIRPHQIMCDAHWVKVPVLLRNWLGANMSPRWPQSGDWLIQAKRAVMFVIDLEDRMEELAGDEP